MIQKIIDEGLILGKEVLHTGNVASYIPELAKGNAMHLGVTVSTITGEHFHAGDWQQEFTMQSISKTISLILALETIGADGVFSKVGVEPTGDAFNSIIRLETKDVRPLNPMINAGAIATAGCCMVDNNTYERFLARVRTLCGRDTISLNEAVYRSEKKAGMKNRAMAYMLQSENIIEHEAEEVLDVYFKMCSTSITTQDLAQYAVVLANDGINPQTKERLVESWIVCIVKTLMVTCGMYDGSGEFAIKVGIPAKSGVGGGILASVEGNMGIAVFGPALDAKGNSVGGHAILEHLSRQLQLHYFSGHTQKSM